jgi:hypothetical protein
MTAVASMRVRVTVTDVWDTVALDVAPDTPVRALKQRALAEATGRTLDPEAYVVKVGGALVLDEQQTVAALGLTDGSPLIVLPARRRPVR